MSGLLTLSTISYVALVASHLSIGAIGLIIGVLQCQQTNIKQRKIIGYVITFVWVFLHVAAAIMGTSINLYVDLIMAGFAASLYGDDFLAALPVDNITINNDPKN